MDIGKENIIEINCDMGESYGRFIIGHDDQIFPLITQCNVACGFHGGDPLHIDQTIAKAIRYGVAVGAHPSYPDLMGFGRRKMDMDSAELSALLRYQIAVIKSLVESRGGRLNHVKPHGALYNTAAITEEVCESILDSIQSFGSGIAFMGMAGSLMQQMAIERSMPFLAEAFGDRRYTNEGTLQSRSIPGSVITDVNEAIDQVLSIAKYQKVKTADGTFLPVKADTICIHGDNPAAPDILKGISEALALSPDSSETS